MFRWELVIWDNFQLKTTQIISNNWKVKIMDDKRIKLLKDAPIKKSINTMALPAILGFMVMAVYNVVDTMFVAWLGTEATGATQVILPVTMLISSIGLCFGIGGGTFLSRLLGNKDYKKANEVASTALFTSVIISIIFTILSIIFIEPLLTLFGASTTIMNLAKSYGFYILLGSLFQMGNMTMNNLLRSEGSAKMSMIGMATGAIINIVLDPIFIFGLNLGIAGAAIATTISQGITFIILISQFLRHKTITRINIKFFSPSKEIYSEIFKIGIPTFLRQLLFSFSIGFMNQAAVSAGGDTLLAAVGIVFKLIMIPNYIIFGIGQGFQPVAGYNYGAGKAQRVKESLSYTLKVSTMVSVISAVILIFFGEQLMAVFKPTEEVIFYGVKGLRYFALGFVFMSFTNTIGIYYQAIGKGKESLMLSVARQGVFFIPAIFILPTLFGIEGVLISQTVADILTMILTLGMYIPFVKKNRLEAEMRM